MLRTTTAVVGAAAFLTALVLVLPSPASTPRIQNFLYQGKTAQAWHRVALQRLTERDRARSKAGAAIRGERRLRRELLRLHRRFKAEPNRPPHYFQWLCIHGYEGAWNDPGSPYYGGLQFSHSTWERNGGHKYASEADQATPLEQMWVAESAWRESGGSFSQWPNTARWCGLL